MQLPEKVPELGFYYHFKHDPNGPVNNYAYEVLGIGFHTETGEQVVTYRPLYEGGVYKASRRLGIPCFDIRPLGMWLEEVERSGKYVPRFRRVTDFRTIAELTRIRNRMYLN